LNETLRNSEVVLLLAATAVAEIVFANYLPVALYLDLSLVLALYIGWNSSPAKGAVSGFAFGLLQDAISGIYLGLNGLSKTLMGFGGAYLSKWLLLEGLPARCVLIGLLSVVDEGIVVGYPLTFFPFPELPRKEDLRPEKWEAPSRPSFLHPGS